MMWCHLYYGGDTFVTRDKNFLKPSKRAKLEGLGAGRIVPPLVAAHCDPLGPAGASIPSGPGRATSA
jgi:hypothetical protein